MTGPADTADRATALRRAFDESFAAPPRAADETKVGLLAIGAGVGRYALPLSGISGLFAARKITRVPAAADELLGLASFRGTIVPVYGLRALLGLAGDGKPRWLAIAAAANMALAFEALEGHLRIPADSIAPQSSSDQERNHILGYLRDQGIVRGVVDIPSITASIARHGTTRD